MNREWIGQHTGQGDKLFSSKARRLKVEIGWSFRVTNLNPKGRSLSPWLKRLGVKSSQIKHQLTEEPYPREREVIKIMRSTASMLFQDEIQVKALLKCGNTKLS